MGDKTQEIKEVQEEKAVKRALLKIKKISISAVLIKNNGDREDLGVISETEVKK